MHTTNSIVIYAELLINNVPLTNYHHALFSMILPIIYVIFEWALNICCNIHFAYPFVDPSNVWNSLFYIAIFGVHLLCWTIAYKFKGVIVERIIRKSKQNMEQLNDVMMDQDEQTKNDPMGSINSFNAS